MLISELIEDLQDALDANGDREVMVAEQPTWPLTAHLVRVYDPANDEADDPGAADVTTEDAGVLWLATSPVSASDRSPYAPARAWAEAYA